MTVRRLAACAGALLCVLVGATGAQEPALPEGPIPIADAVTIEQGRLLAFRSPSVKAAKVELTKVDFSRSTLGGMLVLVRENYLLTIETAPGKTGQVFVMVTAIANTLRPFLDESEAAVREDVKNSAKYRPVHADAVRLDGGWFQLSEYAPSPRNAWSTADYYGHRNGLSYMLKASFVAAQMPAANLREVMQSVEFATAPVRDDIAIYANFLAGAVSPSGLASQFDSVPVARSKRFRLANMTPIPALDGSGGVGAEAHHRAEYERIGGGWLTVLCLPDGGWGRDRLEQILFSGDAISGVETLQALTTPAGEIRRRSFQRRTLDGGYLPARAWTAYRDGVVFEITTDGAPTKADSEAIVAALSDPSRRCQALKAPVPASATVPSATVPSSP